MNLLKFLMNFLRFFYKIHLTDDSTIKLQTFFDKKCRFTCHTLFAKILCTMCSLKNLGKLPKSFPIFDCISYIRAVTICTYCTLRRFVSSFFFECNAIFIFIFNKILKQETVGWIFLFFRKYFFFWESRFTFNAIKIFALEPFTES